MTKKREWARFFAQGFDETEAAKKAGYKNPYCAGKRNRNDEKAIKMAEDFRSEEADIANISEVMEFFTQVMRGDAGGETVKTAERAKAAEFIAKRFENLGEKKQDEEIKVIFDIPRPKE